MDFQLPGIVDTVERSEAGVTFPIIHIGTGDVVMNGDTKLSITIKGMDSAAAIVAERELQLKRMKLVADGDDVDEFALLSEKLGKLTTAWTGVLDATGKPVPVTAELAAELYTKCPYVRDQVNARYCSRLNFSKASPAN